MRIRDPEPGQVAAQPQGHVPAGRRACESSRQGEEASPEGLVVTICSPRPMRAAQRARLCASTWANRPDGRWFSPTPYLRSRIAFSISAWRRWSASRCLPDQPGASWAGVPGARRRRCCPRERFGPDQIAQAFVLADGDGVADIHLAADGDDGVHGWRIRSYATNGRAAPTRDAAPPAVNGASPGPAPAAEWTLHPEPVVVVLATGSAARRAAEIEVMVYEFFAVGAPTGRSQLLAASESNRTPSE